MFYDLENPLSFVKNIEEILDENGVWCCQMLSRLHDKV